ncbi:MAG: hypothetical protein RIM23_29025 [Coleofasciculus sp. G3-WIS-01]|uniref:hypothetical protein n=1 Tax=Coleofasciculus sp. G3-WIS-01 TaxID=3069528 RepID=UPI003301A3BE
MKGNTLLIVVEIVVIGGIIFGWIAPLLFPSEEPEQSQNIVETLPETSGTI